MAHRVGLDDCAVMDHGVCRFLQVGESSCRDSPHHRRSKGRSVLHLGYGDVESGDIGVHFQPFEARKRTPACGDGPRFVARCPHRPQIQFEPVAGRLLYRVINMLAPMAQRQPGYNPACFSIRVWAPVSLKILENQDAIRTGRYVF